MTIPAFSSEPESGVGETVRAAYSGGASHQNDAGEALFPSNIKPLTIIGCNGGKFHGCMGGDQPAVVVTRHAEKRWRERVVPCTRRQARAAILAHASAILTAAAFGATTVKLASRHRLKLHGTTVVTVLPEGRF